MKNRDEMTIKPIAYMRNGFPSKFGLPRQGGLVEELCGRIVFESEFRNRDALRGIEDYSHLWVLWGFSKSLKDGWSPLVRPPRLGGNKRMGVFATRAPNRPNPIGMSCLRLVGIDTECSEGPVLIVAGIDMMDGTPIYDIKPYLPYVDSKPDATGGFAHSRKDYSLDVEFPMEQQAKLPEDMRVAVTGILKGDPRPAYHSDPTRIYGVEYRGYDIRFTVADTVLTVIDIVELDDESHHIFKTAYTTEKDNAEKDIKN